MALSRILFGPLAVLRWGGLPWIAQDDRVMGGLSESQARETPSGALVFEGVLRHERNGGFASVRMDLAAAAAADADLAAVLQPLASWPHTSAIDLLLAPDGRRLEHPSGSLEPELRPLGDLTPSGEERCPRLELRAGAFLRWCA